MWDLHFLLLIQGCLTRTAKVALCMWLLRLGHKRYIFFLDLLGHLWSLELSEVAMLRGLHGETLRLLGEMPGQQPVGLALCSSSPSHNLIAATWDTEPELLCEALPKFLTHGNRKVSKIILSHWVLGWFIQLRIIGALVLLPQELRGGASQSRD